MCSPRLLEIVQSPKLPAGSVLAARMAAPLVKRAVERGTGDGIIKIRLPDPEVNFVWL